MITLIVDSINSMIGGIPSVLFAYYYLQSNTPLAIVFLVVSLLVVIFSNEAISIIAGIIVSVAVLSLFLVSIFASMICIVILNVFWLIHIYIHGWD